MELGKNPSLDVLKVATLSPDPEGENAERFPGECGNPSREIPAEQGGDSEEDLEMLVVPVKKDAELLQQKQDCSGECMDKPGTKIKMRHWL